MTKLDAQDKRSPVWLRIKDHLEAHLAELRATNDTSTTEAETEKLRGRIAEVKDLIALGDDEVTFTE